MAGNGTGTLWGGAALSTPHTLSQGWSEPQQRQDSPRQHLPCICLQEEEKQ